MIKDAIAKLAERIDLSEKEAEEVLFEIIVFLEFDPKFRGHMQILTWSIKLASVKSAFFT